ncbi:hypothetical protein [Streptomyces flavalbus]|uniref:Uncharacterized protein n=1 Tax=Streptomyces flavalbus TaxID=2665155 RepID=A0ABW2WBS0_9ACTN
MIRIVTQARLARLGDDARAALDRAQRAESAASEAGEMFSHALEELSAAQQELLLNEIEISRLREELRREPVEGETLTVLMRYGEPHTIYACREDAYADTATHGVPAGTPWVPARGRPASVSEWRCEAFIYNADSNGFRRAYMPVSNTLGGAA